MYWYVISKAIRQSPVVLQSVLYKIYKHSMIVEPVSSKMSTAYELQDKRGYESPGPNSLSKTRATGSKNNSVATLIKLCKLIVLYIVISAFYKDAFLTIWLASSSYSHSSYHPHYHLSSSHPLLCRGEEF